jgi:hypothetical protein
VVVVVVVNVNWEVGDLPHVNWEVGDLSQAKHVIPVPFKKNGPNWT